jgi:transcriptional regulator with XRE-family HTH domain
MTLASDAPVQRRRLRNELRRLRVTAGLTQQDVAQAMDWSLSKLIRIESGVVRITTNDLKALLHHYGVDDPAEVDRFLTMARAGKEQRAWWSQYREATSQQFLNFLAYENSASLIYQFEPLLIPGLLQDEDYARAVSQAYRGAASDKSVEQWVELRMQRQEEILERNDPPEIVFVMDEAALHRWVGGREVMRHQLRRLKTEATRDNVTIEVVPFRAGAHPGMKGPFVIMEFPGDQDEDVLHLEDRGHMNIREEYTDEIASYREALAELRQLAKEEDLNTVIDRALKEMS